MLLLIMSLEEIFEEAAATAENGPVCYDLLTVLTDQGHIGQVLVRVQSCKRGLCMLAEILPD